MAQGRAPNLGVADAYAPMADFPLLLELHQRVGGVAEALMAASSGVVHEVEVDAFAREAPQRSLDAFADIDPAEALAWGRGRAVRSSFGDHDDVAPVGQNAAHEALHSPSAVRIGRIDERDSHLHRSFQHALLLALIERPIRIPGETPGAKRHLADAEAGLAEGTSSHAGFLDPWPPTYPRADRSDKVPRPRSHLTG